MADPQHPKQPTRGQSPTPHTRATPGPFDPGELEAFHEQLCYWFDHNGRDLPWREPECSPWGVMVSEFMLQQTPVVRVLPVWEQWLQRWPTPRDLAAEDPGEAIRAWGRLGYPRRALRLHAAAGVIAKEYDNQVPATENQLLALPGVGSYTAAAVACFAYQQPTVVVDTNIRRFQARAFTGNALPEPSPTAAEARLAAAVLPTDAATACCWNAATMELGALVCTARSPQCHACPVQDLCAWQRTGCPPAHYQPRGQKFHGTNRQVRGEILRILREHTGPIAQEELLSAVDLAWADTSRRESCLASLEADGLVQRNQHNQGLVQLPQ